VVGSGESFRHVVSEPTVKQRVEAGVSWSLSQAQALGGGPRRGLSPAKQGTTSRACDATAVSRAAAWTKLTLAAYSRLRLGPIARGLGPKPAIANDPCGARRELSAEAQNFIRALRPELRWTKWRLKVADGQFFGAGIDAFAISST